MAGGKGKSAVRFSKSTKKTVKKNMKETVLPPAKPSRSSLLDHSTLRGHAASSSPTIRKQTTNRKGKAKPVLPSMSAFQPSWKRKTVHKKQAPVASTMEDDASSDPGLQEDWDSPGELDEDDEGDDVWDAELTLIGESQEEEEETEQARADALIESLRVPFEELSAQMCRDMKAVLEPATEHIRVVNREVCKLDKDLQRVVAAVNDDANDIQRESETRASGLKDIMSESQAMLKKLLKELQTEYSKRNDLRSNFCQGLEKAYGNMTTNAETITQQWEEVAHKFVQKAKRMVKKPAMTAEAWDKVFKS